MNQYDYDMIFICYDMWIVLSYLRYDVFNDMFEIGYEKDALNVM